MRSLRLHRPEELLAHEEETPTPSPGEVLIRSGSVSICASDLHWYLEGGIGPTRLDKPLVLGHEASGTIAAIGEGVPKLRPGQRVAIEPARPCFECEWCRRELYNVCPYVAFMGVAPVDGALRDYFTWPARLVVPIPDSMTLDEAAILEPLGVGMHAVHIGKVERGDHIAILGAGAIGLSVLQYLGSFSPASVTVSDPLEFRRARAKELGATAVCGPDDLAAAAAQLSGDGGFDRVFECAGDGAAVAQSAEICRIMGQVIIVGITPNDCYAFGAACSRRKQLKVTFSRRSNLTLERAVELAARGILKPSALVSGAFSLEEADEAFRLAAARDGMIRAIIHLHA